MLMTAKVIAMVNQKGGVGKTTTTFHLARAAVKQGKRVLVIDNDPQGNLTSSIARESIDSGAVMYADALHKKSNVLLEEVIVPGVWEGLDLAPTAGDTLNVVRSFLTVEGAPGTESRLKEILEPIRAQYDYIFIDCAPSLDQLTLNGLTAADAALIVSEPKLYSVNGIARLLDTIADVKKYYNSALTIAGVIVNRFEERTVSGQQWLDELKSASMQLEVSVFEPPIPRLVVLADTVEAAQALDERGTPKGDELAATYETYMKNLERHFVR